MPPKKLHLSKSTSPITRRQALKALGSGALLLATDVVASRRARAASQSSGESSVTTPILEPCALTDVRLLDGPFLEFADNVIDAPLHLLMAG